MIKLFKDIIENEKRAWSGQPKQKQGEVKKGKIQLRQSQQPFVDSQPGQSQQLNNIPDWMQTPNTGSPWRS
jgi:hypothetical protein